MTAIFRVTEAQYNQPDRIVTFGPYLPNTQVMDANGALRYIREGGETGYDTGQVTDMRRALRWTRWVNALNDGRKWAQVRLFERLDAMLEENIALVVVPSHNPYQTDTPIRQLAQRLAETGSRVDATGCLIRQTRIKRISYGGPSYRNLHRQTIAVVGPERIAGLPVLLLDDIARSGASLRACREMLYEAGASLVQPVALARVSGITGSG
jgi:hypothetical protein